MDTNNCTCSPDPPESDTATLGMAFTVGAIFIGLLIFLFTYLMAYSCFDHLVESVNKTKLLAFFSVFTGIFLALFGTSLAFAIKQPDPVGKLILIYLVMCWGGFLVGFMLILGLLLCYMLCTPSVRGSMFPHGLAPIRGPRVVVIHDRGLTHPREQAGPNLPPSYTQSEGLNETSESSPTSDRIERSPSIISGPPAYNVAITQDELVLTRYENELGTNI